MKLLEIIEFRSAESNRIKLEKQLNNLLEEILIAEEAQKIKIYNRLRVDNDFSIHLFHDSKKVENTGSQLGLRISSALKEFGLVNHSVWIEKPCK